VLLDAVCSTGSNSELVTPDGRHRWFFSTPRGVYRVGVRTKDPVWVRPDWSFVELGEPIPPPGASIRREEGMLGPTHCTSGWVHDPRHAVQDAPGQQRHARLRSDGRRRSGGRLERDPLRNADLPLLALCPRQGSRPARCLPRSVQPSDRAGRVCVFGGPGRAAPAGARDCPDGGAAHDGQAAL